MTELTWELVASLELAAAENATTLERQRIIKLLEEIYYEFGIVNPIGQWAMRKAMNAIDPGGFISQPK